ncbi:response regulator [Noviherbaspirillum aerium]|uniref:response regulator n=1 Tax=Noviherbaspirillum aerium TaxID=2588497 RepID=UPI00124F4E7D|nr:response regulator [Noviherbaspirillum aerium]
MTRSDAVNILIVDDEPANLLALEAVLERLGENVVRARSGEEALSKVEQADFAAILLDVRMPTISGFETARRIRQRSASSRTPILFQTAAIDDHFPIEEAYALGAVDYLTKPLVPSVLRAKVSFFVELYRKNAELARIQQERHRAALNAKDQRIRLILDNSKDYAFVVTDPNGIVTEWEGGAEAITGWLAAEAVGRSAAIIFTPEDRVAGRPAYEMRMAKETGRSENRRWHICKDGTRFFADGVMVPLNDPAGELRGYAKIFRNATAEQLAAEELQASNDRLAASEARVRLATEAADLGIWIWDPAAGGMRWENDRARQIFEGASPGPVAIGRRQDLACYPEDFLYKDDLPEFHRQAIATVASGERFSFQGRVLREDGSLRWVEMTGRLQHAADGSPHILGMAADVNERKRAEERERQAVREAIAAAETNAKFRTFFEQGSYFAGVMSIDGTMIEANRSCLEMTGLTREQLVGRKFWECGWWDCSSDLTETVRQGVKEAASGGTFRKEMPYCATDGRMRTIDLILAPVTDHHGNILFVAPTGSDITDRKETEERLLRLASDLAEMDRRKTEFLATLAHELRNPLAPLRNGLHILQLAGDDAEMTGRTRDMMERQLLHLVHLVDDLLDVARITRGQIELKSRRVELKPVIANAIESCMPLIEASGHRFNVKLPDEVLMVHADPTRIAQIISNLLNNAAKYTGHGGWIELTVQREESHVVIAVTDNGLGIPAEALHGIFEMFAQVDSNMKRSQGGLGIGLTLVRQLVELHGGSVTASSPGPNQGSAFTVRLPLAESVAFDGIPASSAVHPQAEGERRQGVRVLVVDDNEDIADSMSALLDIGGHTTRVANNGLRALQIAHEFKPDAVFLDIGMPDMDGYAVAKALRQLPEMQSVMLVALTGWGSESDRVRSKEAGFNEHLTKPAGLPAIAGILAKIDHARLSPGEAGC